MEPQISQNPVIMFVVTDEPTTRPLQACSRDYGFDFDEDEIGREMLAPLPFKPLSRTIPEVEADEFEQVFQCLLY